MQNYGRMTYRPTTMGPKAMITTPHYLASQAGMKILENGGNAVEAAIAAASTIGVVYPHMNGIGGDNFWLIYDQTNNQLKGLNGSGRSGKYTTIDTYRKKGMKSIPVRGAMAANTVPGAVAGWDKAFQYSVKHLHGTYRWKELLQPAIQYAKEGFPVTPNQEYWTTLNLDPSNKEFRNLNRFSEFRKIFLKDNGLPFRSGDMLKQHDLARTLEGIAEDGSQLFYKGSLAYDITNDLQANGGVLFYDDLFNHDSEWVNPISVSYRGYKAYNLPPNSQGMASLSILNILNNFDFSMIDEGSSEYYHLLIEATKRAFRERDQWFSDSEFSDIPLDELLSTKRGMELADQIDFTKSIELEKQLDPHGDTVWIGVVDQYGNSVSLIQSIYHDFGSAYIPKSTGVLLQNRGCVFNLDEDHLHRLQPNKRPFHTLNPAMIFEGDSPYIIYGTMGGEGQPQTQAAIITRLIDYHFDVQEAIEAPRWLYGRTWGVKTNRLKMEGRVSIPTRNELLKKGHDIEVVENFTDVMGHAGAIKIDPVTKVKHGAADPRGDGVALGV